MKIRNEQIEALQQQEQAKSKKHRDDNGLFEDMLSQEVHRNGTGAESAGHPAGPRPGGLLGIGGLLNVQSSASPRAAEATEQGLMDKLDSLLDRWENYADTLGSEAAGENLRKAYGMLEDISEGVNQLREVMPDLAEKNPELNALVSEVEVLAATEQFKFNRGDYIDES